MSGPKQTAATGESLQAKTPAAAGSISNMELPKMQIDDIKLPAEIEALRREPIVHNGQRAVTTEQLSRLYATDPSNITDNLDRNRDRFVESVHFLKLTGEALREFKNQTALRGLVGARAPHLILWLERGAARHAKLIQTDEAWEVFEKLEDSYFHRGAAHQGPALPNFADPAAAARAWADQHEARQVAERTKAEIGSRREATAMNTASQAVRKANALEVALVETKLRLDEGAQFATVKRLEKHYGRKLPWRALKQKSIQLGLPMPKIADANYEEVNAYHADVWQAVYGLSIPAVES